LKRLAHNSAVRDENGDEIKGIYRVDTTTDVKEGITKATIYCYPDTVTIDTTEFKIVERDPEEMKHGVKQPSAEERIEFFDRLQQP